MNALLGLETTTKEKKSMIVDCLTKSNLIDNMAAEKIMKKKLV